MAKQALPRFTSTVALTVELSASDEDDAMRRLDRIEDFILERLGKSTFARLEGKPVLRHVESLDASLT